MNGYLEQPQLQTYLKFFVVLVLFTHLKIILLQCFQFLAKIRCIQTDP